MQRVHKPITGISTTNRSRVSNGSKLLMGIDGRSTEARRFRDLIRGYEAEFETASDFDKSLIREAAFLVLKTEQIQSAHLQGQYVAIDEIVRLSGQLRRVLIELKRRTAAGQPITPSLHDHLVSAGPLSSHICTPNWTTRIESVMLIEMVMTVSNMAIHSALLWGCSNRYKINLRLYG